MTFDQLRYSPGVGNFYLTKQGRRMLVSERQSHLIQLEEMGFLRAEAEGRAYYVIEKNDGKLALTNCPGEGSIVRVCPCIRPAT